MSYAEMVSSLSIPVSAGLIGLAWVIVTVLSQRCCHEWKKDGNTITMIEWRLIEGAGHMGEYREVRQPVCCSKCGQMKYFRVG